MKEGEVGLLVTSGTFTSESKKEARNGHRCLRLIDIDEFIDLWIRYYDRMSEEDKALLPIIPCLFSESIKPSYYEKNSYLFYSYPFASQLAPKTIPQSRRWTKPSNRFGRL